MYQAPYLDLAALARAVANGYRVPGYGRDDLAQEAALAMLQAEPCLPFTPQERQRLQDKARDRIRAILFARTRKGRPKMLPMNGYDVAIGDGIDREVAARETLGLAVAALTSRQRAVTLRACERGQEDDTIAEELDTTITAVRVARSQAAGRLREALG